ncbi:MAG: 1-acyl-sn-glycerol-3-phosphate acyltransferase [Intestinimonas sp.]|jgi:1-acyl-sn-glycerol-3-phosphate acyltransferase|nr:1-acyl-sn-glycerol-3-phosphate acyltransferase [Intestinimonas sp.]
MRTAYAILYTIIWPFFSIFHPVKAIGREHIPEEGVLICANHTALSDPLLLVFAFHRKFQIRVMAKAELLQVPVIGWLLKKVGVFGVERGKSDVGAIKQAIRFLKGGENLLLFPEGTRVRESRGEISSPKTGAAMLAIRTGVSILPVYIPEHKRWFRRTPVVIGEPYRPDVASRKGSQEEYMAITKDLMDRIRALGAQVST